MSEINSPESFFGFQLGTDRKIARWDRIVEYFYKLQDQSNRIKVVDMGPSTEGNPFLLCIISSENNLDNLEKIREDNRRLADPDGLSVEEVENLITRGKAVICQSMSLHATEVGGTQMAPELAYNLLTRQDEETKRILENVVFLMIPCFNPDGQIMVTDWYNRWIDTEYEGCTLPWLYHKYTGHDNNRDGFQTNMVESQYMAKIMFQDWTPQHYVDHHHMGSYGARLYVPPYAEPIHPYADPLIWREHSWFGAHMAYKLEEAGISGVINGAQFLAWGHLGFHWITNYHNIAGTLTESANAKLATPLYIHPSQLKGDGRGTLASYDPQTNFPNPWPGGWWKLRDIVEQQKVSAWASLDMAARNRETLLRNAYLKAIRQTERGEFGSPAAYVIPTEQFDPVTAGKLVEKLLVQGIKIHIAKDEFVADDIVYPAGAFVVDCGQPKSGLIKTLLGRTLYPDNAWTRARDGFPLRPQDTATDTMFEFMDVRVDPVDYFEGDSLEQIYEMVWPDGSIDGVSNIGYALDCSVNDAFIAVNRLLNAGVKVSRMTQALETSKHEELHLDFHALEEDVEETLILKLPRVGMYQRYWGGNMDEGWTRFILEKFEFPYSTLMDEEIKEGSLKQKYDAIILPHEPPEVTIGEDIEAYYEKRYGGMMTMPNFPPDYRSGIGKEGVEALKSFVEEGGTLICFDNACELAIIHFKLKLKNVLEDLSSYDFFCPGSTLHVLVDSSHPAAYGMPDDSLILFWNSRAYDIMPSGDNDRYEVVASYPERDILESGWLIGEKRLSRKVAMVVARYGLGSVVLIGFRPQHRAQTHGTFKLVFNSLFV
jgi:hypothetical protein